MYSRPRHAASIRCMDMWRRTSGSASCCTPSSTGCPRGHPKLLFKGGTSLSKAFDLIRRLSEDIDLVVHRDGLGFSGERDPAAARDISNKQRGALFGKLARACGAYVHGDLKGALAAAIAGMTTGYTIRPDEDEGDRQTLKRRAGATVCVRRCAHSPSFDVLPTSAPSPGSPSFS